MFTTDGFDDIPESVRIGGATMLSSIGMALGPVGGGFIYDTFGNYAWLYIGSAALAFGAVAIALA